MRLSDSLAGLGTSIFGIAVLAYSTTFPPMPGQPVGPGLFPGVIGAGLALFGGALLFGGMRRREAWRIELDEWVRRPRMVANFALVIGVLLFYSLTVEWLGFFVTASTFLAVLFSAFGVRRRSILPLALAVTVGMHYGFYTLLRVPLPWGLLEAIAW